MPVYVYKAKEGPGRTVQRELNAESEAAAIARIEAQGLIPVWVRPKGHGHAAVLPSQRGISRGDVTIFTRQLAGMVRSGVPILRGLTTIAEQTENRRLQAVVSDLEASIRDGSMLSERMRCYPRLFPELYVNMVEAGESGGVLDEMLFRLAEARETEAENRRKVQAAMAYPVLVAVVGAVTIFVLLSFFMPRVSAMFAGEQTLPLSWCRVAGEIKRQAPDIPLYWFLIVKGHRTYRYLSLFARRFYPTWRHPTPGPIQALMDHLATARFGQAYCPEAGLIRFQTSRGHLKGAWAGVEAYQQDKPDVRFFLERNPRHHLGEELVCLTELDEANLRRHARRAFLEGLALCQAG